MAPNTSKQNNMEKLVRPSRPSGSAGGALEPLRLECLGIEPVLIANEVSVQVPALYSYSNKLPGDSRTVRGKSS